MVYKDDEDKEEFISLYQDVEALVDGELTGSKKQTLLKKINKNSALQSEYEALKKQKYLLRKWWSTGKKEH